MSDALSKPIPKDMITKDEIIDFLKNNPDFISENLDEIIPPKKRGARGKPADFQAYMIERLRNDKDQIKQTADTLIENSRANMNNQQRIHEAVLRMLEAHSFSDFIQCLTIDLATLLNVDVSVFVVETEETSAAAIPNNGIRIVPEGTIDNWMGTSPVLLEGDILGIDAIYGGMASLIKSQILLRIDIDPETPPALIAFGSRDPDTFNAHQATDQILFLARVVERSFKTWLRMPI